MNERPILKKLEEHDQKFDSIENKLDKQNDRFDFIIKKLMDHDEQFVEIRQDISLLRNEMLARQDVILTILRRLDQRSAK